MKKRNALHIIMTLLLGTLGCHGLQALQQKGNESLTRSQRDKHEWHAATYKGLELGKSRRADALRSLGKPQRIDSPPGQEENELNPEEWFIYENLGEFPGTVTVAINGKSKLIVEIDVSPTNLTKESAIKYLGDDYIVTRYDFDGCLGDEESAPLYESPSGAIEMIEYRDRGIAFTYNRENKVDNIQYVSKPIGTPASMCPKKLPEN